MPGDLYFVPPEFYGGAALGQNLAKAFQTRQARKEREEDRAFRERLGEQQIKESDARIANQSFAQDMELLKSLGYDGPQALSFLKERNLVSDASRYHMAPGERAAQMLGEVRDDVMTKSTQQGYDSLTPEQRTTFQVLNFGSPGAVEAQTGAELNVQQQEILVDDMEAVQDYIAAQGDMPTGLGLTGYLGIKEAEATDARIRDLANLATTRNSQTAQAWAEVELRRKTTDAEIKRIKAQTGLLGAQKNELADKLEAGELDPVLQQIRQYKAQRIIGLVPRVPPKLIIDYVNGDEVPEQYQSIFEQAERTANQMQQHEFESILKNKAFDGLRGLIEAQKTANWEPEVFNALLAPYIEQISDETILPVLKEHSLIRDPPTDLVDPESLANSYIAGFKLDLQNWLTKQARDQGVAGAPEADQVNLDAATENIWSDAGGDLSTALQILESADASSFDDPSAVLSDIRRRLIERAGGAEQPEALAPPTSEQISMLDMITSERSATIPEDIMPIVNRYNSQDSSIKRGSPGWTLREAVHDYINLLRDDTEESADQRKMLEHVIRLLGGVR